jgi:hypothetical protein
LYHDYTRAYTRYKYDVLVDKHTRNRHRRPSYETRSYYGQLQHLVTIRLPAAAQYGLFEPTLFALGAIRRCDTGKFSNALEVPMYEQYGEFEVVDLSTLQCLVGRVKVNEHLWAVIDRTGKELSASATVIT